MLELRVGVPVVTARFVIGESSGGRWWIVSCGLLEEFEFEFGDDLAVLLGMLITSG